MKFKSTITLAFIVLFSLMNTPELKAQLLKSKDELIKKLKTLDTYNDYVWEETKNEGSITLTGCKGPCEKYNGIYRANAEKWVFIFEPRTYLSGESKYVCVETRQFTDKKLSEIKDIFSKEDDEYNSKIVTFDDKIVIVQDVSLIIIEKKTGDMMMELGCTITKKLY